MTSNEQKELSAVFPSGKEIRISDKDFVTILPIRLQDLPKVIDSLYALVKLAVASDKDPLAIGTQGIKAVVDVIPYCMSEEDNKKRIPATIFPEIIEAIIDLNVTEEAGKKFRALLDRVEKLRGKLPSQQGLPPEK